MGGLEGQRPFRSFIAGAGSVMNRMPPCQNSGGFGASSRNSAPGRVPAKGSAAGTTVPWTAAWGPMVCGWTSTSRAWRARAPNVLGLGNTTIAKTAEPPPPGSVARMWKTGVPCTTRGARYWIPGLPWLDMKVPPPVSSMDQYQARRSPSAWAAMNPQVCSERTSTTAPAPFTTALRWLVRGVMVTWVQAGTAAASPRTRPQRAWHKFRGLASIDPPD